MTNKPIFSFIIPTRNRIENCKKLLDSFRQKTTNLSQIEIVLVIDDDDAESKNFSYDGIHLKKTFTKPGQNMGALNMAGYHKTEGDYIMLFNDDVLIKTPGWDKKVFAAFRTFPDNIALVHVNDTVFQHNLCIFPFVSRTYCELLEGICPQDYIRYNIDDHIFDVFNLLAVLGQRRIIYLPNVIFQHLNYVPNASGQLEYLPDEKIHEVDIRRFNEFLPQRKNLAIRLMEHIVQYINKEKTKMWEKQLEAVNDSVAIRLPQHLRVCTETPRPQIATAISNDDSDIENFVTIISKKDALITKLENVINDNTSRLSNLATLVHDKDTHIRNLKNTINEKDAHIENLNVMISDKDRHIINIENIISHKYESIVWKTLNLFSKHNLKKALSYFKKHGFIASYKKCIEKITMKSPLVLNRALHEKEDLYYVWINKNEPTQKELDEQKNNLFKAEPKISIIVPVFNAPEHFLTAMIESVFSQTYSNWELCITDGASKGTYIKRILKEYARKDRRIKLKFISKNRGIAGNSNEAIVLATGDFITFLDHDDTLPQFALYEVINTINKNPNVDFIYSDEDKITEDGSKRIEPHFKQEWAPDTMLSYNYICHLSVIRKTVIDKVGRFREGFDGAQDYDLFLRALSISKCIVHIPKILYHWRAHKESTALEGQTKNYSIESSKRAITDYLINLNVKDFNVLEGLAYGTFQVSYKIEENPEVCIIIPSKDQVESLKKCITSIFNKTYYKNYNILIVDNMSQELETFNYYEIIKNKNRVSIINYNKPFNFSAINNYAVSKVQTDYILLLNNDIEVINGYWLTAMLEHAQRKAVGAVGAKLYYSNDTIQHAGVIIGLGGVAGHSHKHFPAKANGYFHRLMIIQNLSAVTAACMMIRKDLFHEIGGFDEKYSHAFNDVDLCMKIRKAGYLIVYTPNAELYHHESLSRGYEDTPEKQKRFNEEIKLFTKQWNYVLEKGDPYYNPNLTLAKEDFSIQV